MMKSLTISGVVTSAVCVSATPLPNIIVIVADDLGYNDLACYGQTAFPTPRTDSLAAQGMRFTDMQSPASICSPSRYALLTGTDPFRRYHTSHVLFNAEPLLIRPGEWTVASMLKRTGYTTGIVGKWHLGLGDNLPRDLNHPGRGPNDIGFDYSYIVPDGHNMFPRYYMEDGSVVGGVIPPFASGGVELLDRDGYKLLQHSPKNWENRQLDESIGAHLAGKVEAFIESRREYPFFLYFPTCSIHDPQTPDPQFTGKSGIGAHGDYVMEFDWAVGRVLDTLDRLGLASNTLLVVTSDNGGLAFSTSAKHRPTDPWRGAKESSYEGGLRVPFLARWPGKIPDGSINGEPLSLLDLFSTFATITGVVLPEYAALDSFNMLPALLGEQRNGPIRSYLLGGSRGMDPLALREGDWKLIYWPFENRSELYHLGNDPFEKNDLFSVSPEQTIRLRVLLERHFVAGSSRPGALSEGKALADILKEKDVRNAELMELFRRTTNNRTFPSIAETDPFSRDHLGCWSAEGVEGRPFSPEEKLFADRNYVLQGRPDIFDGAFFIPVSMGKPSTLTCLRAGFVWLVTPSPGRNQDSQSEIIEKQGFKKVALSEFHLFNSTSDANLCSVYQKNCAEGEIIKFGKWAVPVFFP